MSAPSMFGSRPSETLGGKLWRVPWSILGAAALLAAIGTATLYSVAGGSMEPWAARHAARFLAGLGLVLAMAMVPLEVWARLAYPAYAASLIVLALVPFVGTEVLGARRWIAIGTASIQPSELMKVALVAALARYYHGMPAGEGSRPARVLVPLAMIGVPLALTLRQPDLGTAILLAVTGLGIVMLAGTSWLYALAGGVAAVAAAPAVWSGLHGYQRRRIEIFLDPDKDPLGAGYHIAQSKIALGSGGFSGRGFVQGTQSQLDFVPEKHTDFVFTIFAEEWGFVGAAALIALYALLMLALLRVALNCRIVFGRLVIAGVALGIFVNAFVNMAMVSGLVPVVGVPLPLISYGGSAMATVMAGLGLALSAHVHDGRSFRPPEIGRIV